MTKISLRAALLTLLWMVTNGSIYNGIQLSSFTSGPGDGIKITTGSSNEDQLGYSVASAGDFNKDNMTDVVIGAPSATVSGRSSAGLVVILFGRSNSALDVDINLLTFVSGVRGFKIFGPTSGAFLGASVSGVGDVNGDKIDDIVIGAPGADSNYGSMYIIYGRIVSSSQPFVDIDLLAISVNVGFKLIGVSLSSQFGWSVAGAGDFNKDGINDIIVGAPGSFNSRGRAYVLMGTAGLPVSFNINNLQTSSTLNGFYLEGDNSQDIMGYSVSSAGDINGDGNADVIIGATQESNINVVVLFGYTAAVFNNVVLNSGSILPSGTAGFAIVIGGGGDTAFFSVSGGRDLNGDGVSDIIIGASGFDFSGTLNTGRTCVLYGSSSAFSVSQMSLSTNMASTIGFCVNGGSYNDLSGSAAKSVGDINGDGIGDFIVGVPGYSPSGSSNDPGAAYVIFGVQGTTRTEVNLVSTFTSGYSLGFTIKGSGTNEKFGSKAISGAGDFNGDGIDDIIVGSSLAQSGAGIVYIIYGERPSAMPTKVPTRSPTFQPTSSAPTAKPTLNPSLNPSRAPSCAPSAAPSQAPSESPSFNPTAGPSNNPSQAPSVQPSVNPTANPSVTPSVQPSVTPTTDPSRNPTASPSTVTPSVSPSAEPSKVPTLSPSITPSVNPSSGPTKGPSVSPSASPSAIPSAGPTKEPTFSPSASPSVSPSAYPTKEPTLGPSKAPSVSPSAGPTKEPTFSPSASPSTVPSAMPSQEPSTISPSAAPTKVPSINPTTVPTHGPTIYLTALPSTTEPSAPPTAGPTMGPSAAPSTTSPSASPTQGPTVGSTAAPSRSPDISATDAPSRSPTISPTAAPSTQYPTAAQSQGPSVHPSIAPSTVSPTADPTREPTVSPSAAPSQRPTAHPSHLPSAGPTNSPTAVPSTVPTIGITAAPSQGPTSSAFPSMQPTFSAEPSLSPTKTPPASPSAGHTQPPVSNSNAKPTASPSTDPSSAAPTSASVAPSAGPSLAPNVVPSVTPTVSPSTVQSVAPSFAPTEPSSAGPTQMTTSLQPTSLVADPSARPTASPGDSPLELPTSQPSSAPTTAPLNEASVNPTLATTASPTSALSADPSFDPSASPTVSSSRLPLVPLSSQPSSVPSTLDEISATPTEAPTADPSVTSSATPLARPSAAPAADPTVNPSVVSTAPPSTIPSAHTTVEPSAGSTVAPSSEAPPEAPSMNPSTSPSADLTVDPSYVPTTSPSAAPTDEPSVSPTEMPTVAPSAGPSLTLTASPTASPSVVPSAKPTMSPSAGPTVRPSAPPSVPPSWMPTVGPSVGPGQTAGPSRAPTIAPSLSKVEQWRAELSDALTAAARRRTADEAYRSTYYELDVGTSALYGTCTGWQSFVSSEFAMSGLLYKPASIELVSQRSLLGDATFVSCADSRSVDAILLALRTPSTVQTAVQCGLHKWVVSTCTAAANAAALCVDCADPCVNSARCESDDEESTLSSYYLAPCVAASCAGGASVTSAAHIITVAYQDLTPAPVILQLDTQQTKSEITVSAELSDSGSVHCAAYPINAAGESYVPTSVSDIVMQNFVASTDRTNTSIVLIRNLQAATEYTVYCAAQSSRGTWMGLPKVKETVRVVRTECCNTINLQASASSVTEASAVRDFLSIIIPVRPAADAKLIVSVVDSAGNVVSPSPFVPSSFAIPAQQSTNNFAATTSGNAKLTLTSSLQALPAGTYTYNVTMVGAASAQYDFTFGTAGNALVVLAQNQPLPAPVLTSAVFSADGSYVAVIFDASTDKGKVSTTFSCAALFEFACASTSSCVWASAREVHAFVSSAAGCAAVDSPVSLTASAMIKAQCQSTSGSCDATSWPSASTSTVVRIAAPSAGSAVSPTVVIKAPSSIGACVPLTLDVSASSGNGGRAWLNPSIAVESSPTTNVTELQHFLSSVYTMSPPTAIDASLLNPDTTYNFVVKLCNFLGQCSTASKRVLVQSGAIPSVSFEGSALRTVQRSSVLSITSDSSYTNCDNVVTRSGLSYQWTVSQGGTELLSLPSQSRDPSKLVIAANSLTANSLYDVRLQVTKLDTGKSNAASIQVFVQSGAIRAVVALGVSRSVRVGQSLSIDARASFDEDVAGVIGAAAGLSFAWSCGQITPVLSDSCDTIISAVTADASGGVYTARAAASAAHAVVQVKLLVRDSSGMRSAEKVITVTVLPALAPVATLTANVASSGVFNSNQELQLTGTVGFPAALNGSVAWSVDDTSAFSLALSAKSPLTSAFAASTTAQSNTVYMVLAANSLPGRSSLTFSLTASLAGTGQTTVASVTVLVNAAPMPGKFVVTPPSGTEITDLFTFAASEWFDDNLPLQYQFGQVSLSGQDSTLRSKKESAFGVAALTAGASAAGFTVTCVVHVFDEHSASTRATFPVVVIKLVLASASSRADLISAGLSSGAASSDGLKQATSMGSYLLNDVDCSSAPSCAALNRRSCFRTQNTCGECLSSAYIGDAGDSNEKCIRASLLPTGRTSRALLASSAGQTRTCDVQDDCGLFETCTMGLCTPQPKRCTGNCSYPLGQCLYVHADSGDTVPHCYVGATDCIAVCRCVDEYAGSATCSLSATELLQKQTLRAQVIQGVASLVALENPDQQVVEGWISSIVASAQVPDELTPVSSSELLRLAQTVLTTATQVGMSTDSLLSLLQVIDSVSQSVKNANQRRRLYSSIQWPRALSSSAEDNTTFSQVETTLTQFKDIALSNILPGQDAVAVTLPQFRLYVAKLTAASREGIASISLPQTALESYNGQAQSSISLPLNSADGSQDSVSVALVSMRVELLNAARGLSGAQQAFSNPLTVQWSDTACTGSACRFDVVLQTTFALHDSLLNSDAPVAFNTTCAPGDFSMHRYACPDGSSLSVNCPGDAVKIISRCNVTKQVPTCSGVSAYGFAETGCQVKARTPSSITCSCPLEALSNRRRVQTNNEDEGASETSVSYVAMLSEVHQSFVDTVVSAQGLNASTVEKGWSALVTVGSLAAALLFGLYWAHNADQEMRKTKPDKKELIVGSSSSKEVDKDSFLARWVLPPSAPDRRRVRKLNKKRVIDKDVQIAEQALPAILRSNQLSNRVTDEIKHHHKYIGIIFFFSSSFPRTLRVLSLAMNVIIMLFMQSLTYSLTNPDDGLCETYQSSQECLDPRSPYATGESKCFWTAETSECALSEPDSSMKVILFVAIFSALMSTPIALAVDWVILSVLAAPTQQPKTNSIVATDSVPGGSSPTHRATVRNGRRTGIAPNLSASASTSVSVSSEQQTRAASVTDLVARSPTSSKRVSRLLSVGSWRGSTVGIDTDDQSQVATINASAQSDLRALVAGLSKYRAELTPSERIEFDRKFSFVTIHFL